MSADLHRLREGAWSLDEFVEHANRLLPDVLPKETSRRAADAVNQRLVRHYATQGLVDEPLKEGREARYLYRHLLQLLVLRRLLAEGFSSAVVGRVIAGRGDDDLERLLTGQLRIDLVPEGGRDGERSEFLRRVREKAGLDVSPAGASSLATASGPVRAAVAPPVKEPAAPPRPALHAQRPARAEPTQTGPFRESAWTRVEIMDGLELMVRDGFRLPDTRLGDAELVQLLKVTLLYLEQKQRGKP